MPGLLSAADLRRSDVEGILRRAGDLRDGASPAPAHIAVALMFYEDSLRTRVGFEAATFRLGGQASVITSAKHSPTMRVPERFEDAVRSIASWFDVLCIRHVDDDASRRAAAVTSTPVINCGNGTDEHPTQALVDLFAIHARLGRLDGLCVGVMGDLDGMRAAHSLVLALSSFEGGVLRTMTPDGLTLPEPIADAARAAGWTVEERSSPDVSDLDVLYAAGLPAETARGVLSEAEQARFRVTSEVATELPRDALVLCPLPRVDEISVTVDDLPQAGYFTQSANALWVRMAVLEWATARSTPAGQR